MAVAPILFQLQANNASGQAVVFLALQNHHWVKCHRRKAPSLSLYVREAPVGPDDPLVHNFSSDYKTA